MKKVRFWAVVLIVLVLAALFGRASADNPNTYDVYIHGEYTCFDFGEWGQCLCPCDVGSECATTLDEPPGIGGGPPVDDWIKVTATLVPTTTPTSVPIPTDRPKDEPTNTPSPTSVIPTREPVATKPIILATTTPIPVTVTPKPTATDVPTSVPPTATTRPTLVPTVPPTSVPTLAPVIVPTVPSWDGGCVCHKKPGAPGKVTDITKCFASHQEAAYNSHIEHGDSKGSCP